MRSLLLIIFGLQYLLSAGQGIQPNLTAEFDPVKKLVLIKWQNIITGVTVFVLQRSADNHTWKDLYLIRLEDFSPKKKEKFYDKRPEPTKNYYRLKINYSGETEYSNPIMVIIGNPLGSWNLYPVPVKDVLNLQYNGSEAIRGVVGIFIQNIYGTVFIRKRYSSLNRIIQVPVDNLGKGTYDVRIVIDNEIVWNQRFIK